MLSKIRLMDEILDEKTYEDRSIKYATFLDRVAAFLLDLGLLLLISRFLLVMIDINVWDYWYIIIAAVLLYFIFLPSSEMQATIGMRLTNIRYVNDKRRDITTFSAAFHFLLSLVLFPALFQLLSHLNPVFYDKLAKVQIIKVK